MNPKNRHVRDTHPQMNCLDHPLIPWIPVHRKYLFATRYALRIVLILFFAAVYGVHSHGFQTAVPRERENSSNSKQSEKPQAAEKSQAIPEDDDRPAPLAPLPEPLSKLVAKATELNPTKTVFLDVPGKRLILRTEIACRTCVLEMLCVPEGIKEHETILRLRSKAYVVHTGLLALGMEPGKPAEFSPEFVAPSGQSVSIYAAWVDSDGKLQRHDVRQWIRHNIHRYYSGPLKSPPPGLQLPYRELRYDKFNSELLWYGPMSDADRDDLLTKWDNADFQKTIRRFHQESQSKQMDADFVFVGSRFYQDPETGQKSYLAEGGYLICLANFADALIDIREVSSANDGAQTYEAWTENLPPEGTPVLLEITPADLPEKSKAPPSEKDKPEAKKKSL